MTTISLHRVLTADEATALVGTAVEPPTVQPIASPAADDDVVSVLDADTGETIALVTRLDKAHRIRLRSAVEHLTYGGVHRSTYRMAGAGRTFGWAPKRVLTGRESCRATSCAGEHPDEHEVLTSLGGDLADTFGSLLPEQASHDRGILAEAVRPDWLMEDRSLWTSGVVNRSSTLPYHRDGANFHTWSAMPTLRYRMQGGHLFIPEYNLLFPCKDGEVTWFCGRDLVHGVTPMAMRDDTAYRYSIVYYAMQGMKNCREFAEETASAAERRTARERAQAVDARAKLAAAEQADIIAVHGGVESSMVPTP